jgi:SAM-dependent methyltransferase
MSDNSKFYEEFAPFYEAVYGSIDASEVVRQWVLLLEFSGAIPRAALRRVRLPRLLDIGCGPGWYIVPWARVGFDVTGLDASSSMLATASRYVARHMPRKFDAEIPQIMFYLADIRFIPSFHEPLSGFDIAVSHFNFLHLFPTSDLTPIFHGVKSILLPGAIWAMDIFFPAMSNTGDKEVCSFTSEGAEHVSRTSIYFSSDRRYEQRWRIGELELVENYWLHDMESLRRSAEDAAWTLLSSWDWDPVNTASPWSGSTEGGERKVVLFKRL